ncbi:MAG: OmpA family protein [Bryobacteraceae bacterium]
MKVHPFKSLALAAILASLASCHKQVAKVQPPPAPAPVVAAKAAPPPPAARPAPVNTPTTVARSTEPDAATKASIQALLNRIQDVYFDYDKHILRADAQTTLEADAKTLRDILKQYPNYKLTVQGFCDERGSEEYNLALGDARAKQAKDFLVTLGLPSSQLVTVSFGKDKPVCTDQTESCWQRNRRAHITQEQAS